MNRNGPKNIQIVLVGIELGTYICQKHLYRWHYLVVEGYGE